MCESNAYIYNDGEEVLILKDVEFIQPQGDQIFLRNILGEEKLLKKKIKYISLIEHKILLE